jgi:hypothetical protein
LPASLPRARGRDRTAVLRSSRRPPWRPRPARRPGQEVLEGRRAPATFTVNNTLDSGPNSPRQAIVNANANPLTADTINLGIGSGAQVISLTSALPAVTGRTTLAGNTQPGFAGTPLIELNGPAALAGVNGLVLRGVGSVVRGLDVVNFRGKASWCRPPGRATEISKVLPGGRKAWQETPSGQTLTVL